MFQILLAGYGVSDVLEAFEVDEAMDFVFGSEAIGKGFAVFADAATEVVCDANIELAGSVGENVDVVLVFVVAHWGKDKAKAIAKADPPPLAKDDNCGEERGLRTGGIADGVIRGCGLLRRSRGTR